MRIFFSLLLLFSFGLCADQSSVSRPGFADLIESKKLLSAVVNIVVKQKVITNSNQSGRRGAMKNIPQGSMFEEFRDFFEKVLPFVEDGEDHAEEVVSLGSGFIIDKGGIVVTNRHVVSFQDGQIADYATVTFSDNSRLKAVVLGVDMRTDLAVLKIESADEFHYVEFSDSDDVRVGDWVLAVGNPFGLGGSVTAGIVSAQGRDINVGQQQINDFIQTDAAINRGNSGGPLFNSTGKVIGINTVIVSPSGGNVGVGFAIPSNVARPVVERLAMGKQVERGWMGVKVQLVTQEIADSVHQKKAQGALVLEVTEGGPAEKAGVKIGDIIVAFNGRKVDQMKNLLSFVSNADIGSIIDIEALRYSSKRTQNITLRLKIGKLDEGSEKGAELVKSIENCDSLGITVANLSADSRKKYAINPSVIKGIVILDVRNNSSQLIPGDVITRVGDEYIDDVKKFLKIIQTGKRGESVLLLINRRGSNLFVGLKLAK